jgi:hypothetical protein
MTAQEIDLIRQALALLHRLVPPDELHAGGPALRRCPVIQFATQYLMRDPGRDATSAELWRFYMEIVTAGELEPLTKQEFLRKLPGALEATFGAKKCHNVERDGSKVRGFRAVTIREEPSPVTALGVEPE